MKSLAVSTVISMRTHVVDMFFAVCLNTWQRACWQFMFVAVKTSSSFFIVVQRLFIFVLQRPFISEIVQRPFISEIVQRLFISGIAKTL